MSENKIKNKKIGIITWHYYSNVGSILQAYAMQHIFSNNGFDCELINYRPRNGTLFHRIIRYLCSFISDFFPTLLPEKMRFRNYSFQKHYFIQSKLCRNKFDLRNIVSNYDIVICGSDQIWAPNVLDTAYLLDFVPESIPKISYAASIGIKAIPENLINTYIVNLKRFSSISVREKEGRDLLKSFLPNDVMNVLDPTYLIEASEWSNLAKKVNEDNFVFCYFLGDNEWQRKIMYKFAKKMNFKVIIYSDNQSDMKYADMIKRYLGPKEFLGYIKKAKWVFSDSFHGISLSLIMKKDFSIFLRFEENDPINQNSRIYNIVQLFNLEDYIIKKTTLINEIKEVDYKKIMPFVEKEKSISKEFIHNSLEGIHE